VRQRTLSGLLALGMLLALVPSAFADGYLFTTLPFAGNPTGINSSGQIVGSFSDATGIHGFLCSGGIFTVLEDPNAPDFTEAYGTNDSGQIVGFFNDATGHHAFIDTGGVFTMIDDPASVPGNTTAYGINDAGQIVGHFADATGGHGFLYSGGTFTTINYPGAPNN